MIAQEAWDCIWEELIQNGKGARTVFDRPGYVEEDYNFSAEMLQEMIREQNRLVTKYSGSEWDGNKNADRIVQLIVEHRAMVQMELNEVNSGVRKLTDRDFLGPKERAMRRKLTHQDIAADERKDHSDYFLALEQKSREKRLREMKELALRSERETRLNEREARVIEKMKRIPSHGNIPMVHQTPNAMLGKGTAPQTVDHTSIYLEVQESVRLEVIHY